jgi:hypothetical protein
MITSEKNAWPTNQVGIGLSYRPARLQRLAEFGSLELILGLFKSFKIPALGSGWHRPGVCTLHIKGTKINELHIKKNL